MPNLAEKEKIVQELKEKLEKAQSVVLADYRGLNVAEITALRKKLRECGGEFKVAKNTLTRLAARQLNLDLDQFLEGPTALAFAYDDPVEPAKVLVDFAKENEKLSFKAGVLQGRIIGVDEIKGLAALPPRKVLIGKVLGGMMAPLYGFAGVLQANLRNLVYVLEAIRQKKEAEGA